MSGRVFGQKVLAGISMPWSGFVAGFVYFVVLTATVIGGGDLPWQAMAFAYLLPVAAYAGMLALRAAHALASLEIGLDHVPHAIIR